MRLVVLALTDGKRRVKAVGVQCPLPGMREGALCVVDEVVGGIMPLSAGGGGIAPVGEWNEGKLVARKC